MKIEAVLFDLDGTLANTLPLCIKVYQQSLEHFTGRHYTESEVSAHFGVTEAGIFQRLLPERWQEGLNYYHTLYEELHDECAEPFVGIKEALSALLERKVRLAIITGKGNHTANLTAHYLGLDHYFDRIESGSEHTVIKSLTMRAILRDWDVSPQYAAYVGDTDSDIKEALDAHVIPLAAEWADTATTHLLTTLKPFASFKTVESFTHWIEQNVDFNA